MTDAEPHRVDLRQARPHDPAVSGTSDARAVWTRAAIVSTAVYGAITAYVTFAALRLNHGTLVYTLDDPYIHLALARTWLRSGTIGITPGEFAPASSSPLWTFLLTGLAAVVGPRDWLPLGLDVLASLALLWGFWRGVAALASDRSWQTERMPKLLVYGAAALLPLLIDLPGQTLTGMEDILQATLTIGFTVLLFGALRGSLRPRGQAGLFLLAMLLPLVRLECAFILVAAAMVLVLRRRWGVALAVAALGAAPIVALGIYSVGHGAMFLPNSIVAKAIPQVGVRVWFWILLHRYQYNIGHDPTLTGVIVIGAIWLYWSWRTRRREGIERAAYFLVSSVLHVTFAGVSLFSRYEEYLIVLGLFLVAQMIPTVSTPDLVQIVRDRAPVGCALACLVVLGFGVDKINEIISTPLASNNIYSQQYQMGRFISEFFPDDAIAANDVGLVSLRANGHVTDLVGLGSTPVLRRVRAAFGSQNLSSEDVEPILKQTGTEVIVIYPGWFNEGLYSRWYRVASWTLGTNVVTPAYPTVVFFAHDASEYPVLLGRLKAFQAELPSGVRVEYYPPPGNTTTSPGSGASPPAKG